MLDLDSGGNPRLTLRAAGAHCLLTGATAVNDGKWHHVIAEVDRGAAKAWQFGGPQARDFTGRRPTDGKRDAGAIEYRE